MKTRLLIACLTICVFAVFGLFFPVTSNAGVDVNINVPLPGLVMAGQPDMAVIPGTYAYYAPGVEANLFFYNGYWYRPYQGRWYVSLQYNGPWGYVAIGNVPHVLINLPPYYRQISSGYGCMPYGMVMRNWRAWQNERYWDNYSGDGYGRQYRGHGMGMGMGMGK